MPNEALQDLICRLAWARVTCDFAVDAWWRRKVKSGGAMRQIKLQMEGLKKEMADRGHKLIQLEDLKGE